MSIPVTMPRLSDTMQQGTVVKWHVKVGDTVQSGQTIADIETDKATMELQSFDAGRIASLAAGEGQTVPVGTVICVIAEEGEDVATAGAAAGASAGAGAASSASRSKPASASGADGTSGGGGSAVAVLDAPAQTVGVSATTNGLGTPATPAEPERIFVSPLARKLAAERNIDLQQVSGTGPSGRIVRADIEAATRSGAPGQVPGRSVPSAGPSPAIAPAAAAVAGVAQQTIPLTSMRATIARRLVESKTTIPHYQVTVSVRLDALLALREQLNAQLAEQGLKLSVNDFLVRACALAMHSHPQVNSSWVERGPGGQPAIQVHGRVNVGVAISLPVERGGGLVVGTLRDADKAGLRQISTETRRLASKARDKGLTIEEMSESTFTISNLGMFGVDHFTAIINPPNAAILAVGRAVERVFAKPSPGGSDPAFEVGHEMSMTLSSDHRIIDGAMAAAYLGSVKSLLEKPATLLI